VVEACARDVLVSQQSKDIGYIGGVAFVDGQAQANLYPRLQAVADASQCQVECTLVSSKSIVRFTHTVERYANVAQTNLAKSIGSFRGNERAVGGDNSPHAEGDRAGGQLE
jgi:hypothetical protein